MSDLSRRNFMRAGTMLAGAVSTGAFIMSRAQAADSQSFMAASTGQQTPDNFSDGPGLQGIYALCEVTGGGEKVYGIAIQYDTDIDPASLALGTYTAGVVPATTGYFPGEPVAVDKDASNAKAKPRAIHAIYTNAEPALNSKQTSIKGKYVIAEFQHDTDLSIPTTDSDKVTLRQDRSVKTLAGKEYAASSKIWSNAGQRGNNVIIGGIEAWEQSHWWWDDSHATWLEYSIYLPKSFLKPEGEKRSYPLVLAITHSGTSYDGTCEETLTEQCIASIWGTSAVQDREECVVITPRYERTTMNDYWEHTYDVENTHRLVEYFLTNTWNHGNPNLADRSDKTLRIDPKRVYCTGWSMGAMTTLWLMAKHPDTFAAGLVIDGQQRPSDVATLANQKVLIITGENDQKATEWNEKCVPVWKQHGARVVRPETRLDPSLVFPVNQQQKLTAQINGYLAQGGNITFLTFTGIDHMAAARTFFYINAARDWLLKQVKS